MMQEVLSSLHKVSNSLIGSQETRLTHSQSLQKPVNNYQDYHQYDRSPQSQNSQFQNPSDYRDSYKNFGYSKPMYRPDSGLRNSYPENERYGSASEHDKRYSREQFYDSPLSNRDNNYYQADQTPREFINPLELRSQAWN